MPHFELLLPPKQKEPAPLILILPILGQLLFFTDLWIERMIAHFFVRKGFAVAILRRDFFQYLPHKGIEQVGDYLSRTVEQAKLALDELVKNPAVDATRIGSLGISLGGVLSVLLAAEEPRLKACVVALAGGNIPEIIVTSKDPLLSSYCRELLRGLKLSREEFVRELKKDFKEDPLEAAKQIDPEKILMVIARFDHVVFPRYALALWEALRKPKAIFVPLGHYFTILVMAYLNRRALAFFKQRFAYPFQKCQV